jgi:hypothetical protein
MTSTTYGSTGAVMGQPPPSSADERRWREWWASPEGVRHRQWQVWQAEQHAQQVRAAVAARLELVSLNHAEHAWALRNSFGIAATATALMYVDGDRVAVAGKLFPDGEQVADTSRVLFDVCQKARQVMAAGSDPRVEMSENPDPMSESAMLVGVAVSLLDTPGGTWTQVRQRTTGGGLNIPGRVLALLVDDTMMLADRVERHHPEHYHVAISAYADRSFQRLGRRWTHVPQLVAVDDSQTRPLWLRLWELRAILTGAEHGR